MKKFKVIIAGLIVAAIVIFIYNKTAINSISTNASKPAYSNNKYEAPTNIQSDFSSNIIIKPDAEAAKIPMNFYEYINKKDYEKAVSFFGPTLKFQGEPSMRKYLENLQKVTIKNFKDISDQPGYLDPEKQKYYAVKVYYADLDIKVKDKNLVPYLNQPQHRKFYVIKENKDSPWLLDGDEATEAIQ